LFFCRGGAGYFGEDDVNQLNIVIPGNPISKKRPRFARRGRFVQTYNPQESEEGKFVCLMQNQINHDPISAGTPIDLKLEFHMPFPASISKKKKESGLFHTKKPDLDNLIKFVKDCANGILWHDDSQVVRVEAVKCYRDNPATHICINW
jgi:Holliday junction resolvase RusA-like endonuclease